MAKTMKIIAAISLIMTIISTIFYSINQSALLLSLSITFGTIAYHFYIRLLVGKIYDLKMKNCADYTKAWYKPLKWEEPLYKKLKVKQWKNQMPTYDIDVFNPRKNSWNKIAQAMCQSELVHETNAVLSFLPLLSSLCFGEFTVFLITSCIAAGVDIIFVIMQRYNRPRVIKMIEKQR